MKLKKILSLIFVPFAMNLSIKTVNSYDISYGEVAKTILELAAPGVPIGLVAEPCLVAVPLAAITLYNKSQKVGIFSNIKKYLNKSFKIVKWLGLALAGLCVAGYNAPPLINEDPIYKLIYITGMSASGVVSLASWIGQKLTESKDENLKNGDNIKTSSNDSIQER